MKLALLVATVLIPFSLAAPSYAGVVIGVGGSYGINLAPGGGKPFVAAPVTVVLPPVTSVPLDLELPSGSSSLAAGVTLPGAFGLINQLTPGTLTSGVFNMYKFTVGSCIDSFVSSVLFEEEIVGLKFLNGSHAGLGLFVLGVEGKRLTFAGYSPFNSGFDLEIYTAGIPALPASATPEPSTLLMWGGLVALCGATRSLRRLY